MLRTAATIALMLTAGGTLGQFTNIHGPAHGERGHARILSDALGETFSALGSRSFGSDSYTASRVNDNNDKTWWGGTYNATIIAREAGYSHTFGYIKGGSFTGLLQSADIGSSATVTIDGDFAWAIKNHRQHGGDLWSSRPGQNADWKDHMVTYSLLDGERMVGYAIFFEDLPSWCWDKDYNDVGVILTIVPAPQAAGLGLAGLAGLGVAAGRRRR